MTKKRANDLMSLPVALSFADMPRRVSTLQAPADTMDELYEALGVVAKAYRDERDDAREDISVEVVSAKIGDMLFEHLTIARNGAQWKSERVAGETKGCWVLDNGDRPNKKTLITAADRQGHRTRYYTYDEMVAKNFCDKYARDIASAVSVCGDPVKLRAIAALIGKELSA